MSENELTPVDSNLPQSQAEIDKELTEMGKDYGAAGSAFPVIRVKGNRFIFPDDHEVEKELELVILGARLERRLWMYDHNYASRMNLKNGVMCCARSDNTLSAPAIPFEGAPKHPGEGITCMACPENKWEGPPNDRKKVGQCKDGAVMAVMAPDLMDKQTYLLHVSATAMKDLKSAIAQARTLYAHPVKCVYSVQLVPAGSSFRVKVTVNGVNQRYHEFFPYIKPAEAALDARPLWYTEMFPDAATETAAPTKPDQEDAAPMTSTKRKSRSAV